MYWRGREGSLAHAQHALTTKITAPRSRRANAAPELRASGDILRTLLVAIAARDATGEAAIGQLHDLTLGTLTALARAMLRDRRDAEEIVCDTYVQVWQTARSYSATRGAPIAWLITICRSRAFDRLRQRKVQNLATQSAESQPIDVAHDVDRNSPDRLLDLLQTDSAVHAALSKLPAERQRLVEMAFLEGLSHQEICERSHLPLGTVKSHLRRSLQTLRTSFETEAT